MERSGNENATDGGGPSRAAEQLHRKSTTGSPVDLNVAVPGSIRKPSLPGQVETYIQAGFQLIPLHRWDAVDSKGRPRGKTPRDGAWGVKDYDSADVVDAAIKDGRNIGVRLPASVMVLDVDPRNFGDGDSLLSLQIETGMDLRGVPQTATGSGGAHYWFNKPIDVQLLDSLAEYPGVEFKSIGRQVVAAGSIHPNGKTYAWVDGVMPDLRDLPDIPDALLQLIKRPVRSHGEAAGFGELTCEMLVETLEQLDPCDFQDHDEWLLLMMACHHATAGDARQEFIDWSTQDGQYADDGWIIGRRWDSLHAESGRGGKPITVRYLHKVLQAAGGYVVSTPPEDDFDVADDDVADGQGVDHDRITAERADADLPPLSAIEKFNADHFTVLHGGKFLVGRERRHPTLGYHDLVWTSDEAFRKFHNTEFVETPKGNGTTLVGTGKFWVEHPKRRQFDCVVFDPSPSGATPGAYNLWKGWAVEPKRGDWSLMRRLIRDVLCGGDVESYEYVIRWMAFMVQFPHVPAEVAIVLKGKKGRGKGMFGRALKELAGDHGRQIAQGSQLTGRFNDHLMGCICLFVDEGFWAGDKQGEGALKNLITEDVLSFEGKGLPIIQGPNLLHIIMASNEEWVIPASEDERRFAVFEVDEVAYYKLPAGFFADLVAQKKAGGQAAMLFDLLQHDIKDRHPRDDIPRNEARGNQVLKSLCEQDPLTAYWHNALDRGELPYTVETTRNWSNSPQVLKEKEKDAFTDSVNDYASTRRFSRGKEYSKRAVAQFLKKLGNDIDSKDGGLRSWHIPALGMAREQFEQHIGMAIDWED